MHGACGGDNDGVRGEQLPEAVGSAAQQLGQARRGPAAGDEGLQPAAGAGRVDGGARVELRGGRVDRQQPVLGRRPDPGQRASAVRAADQQLVEGAAPDPGQGGDPVQGDARGQEPAKVGAGAVSRSGGSPSSRPS